MKPILPRAALLAVFAAAGCAAARPCGVDEYYSGDPTEARRIYTEKLGADRRSRALYLALLGTVELDAGDIGEARRHFAEATSIMDSFAAKGEVGALVGEEASKEYKGDPYEQMMAHWYLGLLDYMHGDYDMALPSFRSAALADGGSREERHMSDAASVFVMMGKTYRAMGEEAKAAAEFDEAANVHTFTQAVAVLSGAIEAGTREVAAQTGHEDAAAVAYDLLMDEVAGAAAEFAGPAQALEAAAERASAALEKTSRSPRAVSEGLAGPRGGLVADCIPRIRTAAAKRLGRRSGAAGEGPLARVVKDAADPANNLTLIVGLGRGPYKFRSGLFGRLARVARASYPERRAEVYVDGVKMGSTATIEDIYYQASTRGGRAMDGILAGKAVFKAALLEAAEESFEDAAHDAGAKEKRDDSFAKGVFLLALSGLVRAEADIRAWETLPDKLQFLAAEVPPGRHMIEVAFFGDSGRLPSLDMRWEDVDFAADRETVIYVRSGAGGAWAAPRRRYASGLTGE